MAKKEKPKNNKPADDYREPEEVTTTSDTNDQSIPETIDPIVDDAMIERPHAKSQGPAGTQPMPEYTIDTSKQFDQQQLTEGIGATDSHMPGAQKEEMPPYEELKKQQQNMNNEQIKDNAENTADMLFDLYDEVWRRGGNWIMEIGEKRAKKIEKEHPGILSMPVHYGNITKPVGQVFAEFDAFSHDKVRGLNEKEKELLRPILIAELTKRGAVISPLMYAGIVLIKHAFRQGKIIKEAWQQRSDLLEGVKATFQLYQQRGSIPKQQPEPVQANAPQQTETVQQQAESPVENEVTNNQSADLPTVGVTNSFERTDNSFRNIQNKHRTSVRKPILTHKKSARKVTYKKKKHSMAE